MEAIIENILVGLIIVGAAIYGIVVLLCHLYDLHAIDKFYRKIYSSDESEDTESSSSETTEFLKDWARYEDIKNQKSIW